ncbi:MAG: hypothetical protein GXX85_17750 [Ignavibacteria bacterium]|nr:hypothetical protein [Ignavibacteria bacterium]
MDSKQLAEKSKKLQEQYLAELSNVPNFPELKREHEIGKMEALQKEVQAKYIRLVDLHITDIKLAMNENRKALIKLKYPETSTGTLSRQNGLLSMVMAKVYLAGKKNKEQIILELEDAMALENTDYISCLLDEIFSNKQSDPNLKGDILELVKLYEPYKGLNELEKEKHALKAALDGANYTKGFLTNAPTTGINNFQDWQQAVNL